MRRYRLLPLLFIIAAGLFNGCQKRGRMEIGDEAPAIALASMDGGTKNVPGDYSGKIILIRFWSIDCHFCDKQTLLTLEQFHQRYKGHNFIPIAINEGPLSQDDNRLKPLLNKITYPMLVDEHGSAARHFGVIALPTTFILDGDGVLRGKITGEANAEKLEKLFTTILNKGVFYDSGY